MRLVWPIFGGLGSYGPAPTRGLVSYGQGFHPPFSELILNDTFNWGLRLIVWGFRSGWGLLVRVCYLGSGVGLLVQDMHKGLRSYGMGQSWGAI